MKLRFFRNLVFAALLIGFVASCIDDNGSTYIPPTHEEEMALLNEYLDTLQNRGLDIDTTELGVYYIVDSIGEGAFPLVGDTCEVKYTGFFIDGSIFDTSGTNTFEFILGSENLIPGWNDGMKVINKGAFVYLLIPSELAYGSTGYSSVPPNTTIIFNIEMVDIKQGY
ncbi:FKBP-type peptidyl-prolyl cis-trans isomerase [uncultured Draconibacterium sp.]|uniref:FKBP-type peptidyl-prolyl cis-trans isomerase n=1 Tax=uncultured Draconibacterium sp. TaxID=1573823 RepID=UPI003216F3C4